MIRLKAGNLWKHEFLNRVIELNRMYEDKDVQITSLYGSLHNFTASARCDSRVPSYDIDYVRDYVRKAKKNNINIRWTLNESCIGSMQDFESCVWPEYYNTIRTLWDIGIHEYTVASPLLATLLNSILPSPADRFIEISTIAEVSSVAELDRWLDLGVNGVNVSIMINRDLTTLYDIFKYSNRHNIEVTLLANEACLWKCPYRRECYNLSSHNSDIGPFRNYPFNRCNVERIVNPSEWIKARMILPQWMKRYESDIGIHNFKVTGRTSSMDIIIPILVAYMEGDYKGNLLDLWPTIAPIADTIEPKDSAFISCKALDEMYLYEHFISSGYLCASKDCEVCGYCEAVYNAASQPVKTDE